MGFLFSPPPSRPFFTPFFPLPWPLPLLLLVSIESPHALCPLQFPRFVETFLSPAPPKAFRPLSGRLVPLFFLLEPPLSPCVHCSTARPRLINRALQALCSAIRTGAFLDPRRPFLKVGACFNGASWFLFGVLFPPLLSPGDSHMPKKQLAPPIWDEACS